MITGIEGIPGSGKSYEAVVYHVLDALKNKRKVITNLPLNIDLFAAVNADYRYLIEIRKLRKKSLGTWVVNGGDNPAFNVGVFAADNQKNATDNRFSSLMGRYPHVIPGFNNQRSSRVDNDSDNDSPFSGVWCYYDTYRSPDNRGPLFVIDEAHISIPAREVGGLSTDNQVIEYYKIHRHFNVDILLITQSFRDINQPIARLMAALTRVRKADIFGDNTSYIRKVYSGYRGGIISTEKRLYKPEYFPFYKSHTQGLSIAELGQVDFNPFIVRVRKYSKFYYLFGIIFIIYAFWPKNEESLKSTTAFLPPASASASKSSTPSTLPLPDSKSPTPSTLPPPDSKSPTTPALRDPYSLVDFHLSGFLKFGRKTVHMLTASRADKRLFDLRLDDLERVGYKVTVISDCLVLAQINDVVKSIVCDAPTIGMGNDNSPVVIKDAGAADRMLTSDKKAQDSKYVGQSADDVLVRSAHLIDFR